MSAGQKALPFAMSEQIHRSSSTSLAPAKAYTHSEGIPHVRSKRTPSSTGARRSRRGGSARRTGGDGGGRHRLRRRQPQERARRHQRRLEGRGRQAGDDLLRGELGPRQADRGGRPGRRLRLGRRAVDGLSLRAEPGADGHDRRAARQPPGADRAGRFRRQPRADGGRRPRDRARRRPPRRGPGRCRCRRAGTPRRR